MFAEIPLSLHSVSRYAEGRMTLEGRVVVVTGAGHGIGRALAERFARERPGALVLADADGTAVESVAGSCGGQAVVCDLTQEAAVGALVAGVLNRHGHVDLMCSNAGVFTPGSEQLPTDAWTGSWNLNVMAHVWAARAALPAMLERGEGYFLHTASAAGLLSQIGSAVYAVTKHAAVAFAEWLAIHYGDRGIKVSCLCPQGVRTRMLGEGSFLQEGSLAAEEVAEAVVAGLAAERFLILPHAEVEEYFRRKANDYDRWLNGMRRLRRRVEGSESDQ
jgi:NAD(P)-dependent dehydrogenase (short-subunit alcohol dehydrogenase family)